MAVLRVGLVPHVDAEGVDHLHRAALIVTRAPNPLGNHYGRAPTVCLDERGAAHRIPVLGVVVIYGSEDRALARAVSRSPAASMLIVTKAKPKEDSDLAKAIARLGDRKVTMVTIGAKAKVKALDFAPDKVVLEVADLSRPPQQQTAPSTPRPAVKPIDRTAPTLKRKEPKVAKRSVPSLKRPPVSAIDRTAPRRPKPEPNPPPKPRPSAKPAKPAKPADE